MCIRDRVGGATDIQGKFQLAVTIPNSKSILLHISYIGYTSVYRTISVSANNKTPTLGNISLSPESISLKMCIRDRYRGGFIADDIVSILGFLDSYEFAPY